MKSVKFTPEEDAILRANYLTLPAKRLSKMLNRSESGARQRMALLGLVVPPEVTAKFIAESKFKKGQIPPNAGKKQIEYMTAEAIERTKATRFKKGIIPANSYNEVGKITIRKDTKSGRIYQHICLALGRWKLLHQHKWENAKGKVPKGMCLWYKDGDTSNCELSNLELITRKENRFRNASHQLLTNKYLARCIVGKMGDPDGLENEPELLAAKKAQLLINRKIKDHGKQQTIRP